MALTALDFPASPTVGDLYPDPPVTGQPTYKWSGTDWLAFRAAPLDTTVPYAPFAAMAYSGMQINGSMEVSQERAYGVGTGTGYICDGWSAYYTDGITRSSKVLEFVATTFGVPTFLSSNVTVAKPSLVAGDLSIIYQNIEGYRVSRLAMGNANAKSFTLGFWANSNRTGLYCGSIHNAASATRSYVFTYTQDVANAWEYKTVTIPGDTAGTWTYTNTVGMVISFTQAAGSDFIASSANTWHAGNFKAVAAQVNAVAATSDIFNITGVVVLPGTEAPSASQSPLIMRPYDQELVTCRRYWRWVDGLWGVADATTTRMNLFIVLEPPMRAAPTATAVGTITATDAHSTSPTATSPVINTSPASPNGGYVAINGFTGLTPLRGYGMVGNNNALRLDARL